MRVLYNVAMKYNADALRKSVHNPQLCQSIARNQVYIVLDNVLDTYNIGAVFRLADAVAAEKVILCAGSETPPNSRIKKASINTTEWVPWEYFATTGEAIKHLRQTVPQIQIVAVEQSAQSVAYDTFHYTVPVALVVGHETDGVSEEIQSMCDATVELPMWGINISLNVMVSLGIVLYKVMSLKKS